MTEASQALRHLIPQTTKKSKERRPFDALKTLPFQPHPHYISE